RARTHAEAEAQNERWLREQAEARKRATEQAAGRAEEARRRAVPISVPVVPAPGPAPARKPSLESLFTFGSARAAAAAEGRAPRLALREPALREPTPAPVAVTVAAPPPREPRPAAPPSNVMEKGARVRVRTGPFADKIGVIGELDGRGGARVLLGLLSTRLDLGALELSLEGRERPTLQSSHHKPLAPSPRKAR
ncbi:MAG: KOW motif-containing protein, partial [Minicystis sp.]